MAWLWKFLLLTFQRGEAPSKRLKLDKVVALMNFSVPDMSCGHCTASIEKAVKAADPDAGVSCDLPNRQVRVDSTLPTDRVQAAIRDAGYEAEPATL